jgi:hypothetical protein
LTDIDGPCLKVAAHNPYEVSIYQKIFTPVAAISAKTLNGDFLQLLEEIRTLCTELST